MHCPGFAVHGEPIPGWCMMLQPRYFRYFSGISVELQRFGPHLYLLLVSQLVLCVTRGSSGCPVLREESQLAFTEQRQQGTSCTIFKSCFKNKKKKSFKKNVYTVTASACQSVISSALAFLI